MKVKDLIAALEECNPNNKVAFSVEKAHATIGGTPRVEVEAVRQGFDWDDGTVFLQIEDGKRLTEMSKEEYISLIRYKQLVMGLRGKEEITSLSDIFTRKDFAIGLLEDLRRDPSLDISTLRKLSKIISKIKEEKL